MEMEYVINFNDVTMIEANGEFDKVDEIMTSENIGRIDDEIRWAIRSFVTISSLVGFCNIDAQFLSNKEVNILSFSSSCGYSLYNSDLKIFSSWIQDSGWGVPEPSQDLIDENKEFWKYFYDALIIDSRYLDSLYGKRDLLNDE